MSYASFVKLRRAEAYTYRVVLRARKPCYTDRFRRFRPGTCAEGETLLCTLTNWSQLTVRVLVVLFGWQGSGAAYSVKEIARSVSRGIIGLELLKHTYPTPPQFFSPLLTHQNTKWFQNNLFKINSFSSVRRENLWSYLYYFLLLFWITILRMLPG